MNSKRKISIVLHVLFTLVVLLVPIVFLPLKDNKSHYNYNGQTIVFTLLQGVSFYFNSYWLYPRLLIKKKIAWYITAVIITSLVIAAIAISLPGPNKFGLSYACVAHAVIYVFVGLFVMGTSTCYRFIMDVMKDQHLRQENLTTELSFLRSQVSPHFMFNTLNSMVALARKKSDKLETSLLKMSALMHYMLYDADEEKVQLSKEIDYIHSYIELQTLRFGDTIKILLMVNPPDKDYSIEPMLLIPLIENAFKHGSGVIKDPEICIQLIAREKTIALEVSNKMECRFGRAADRSKGIGLANLHRRLNLLYPGKYQLQAEQKNDWHYAYLKIQLNDTLSRSR
ncbi:MAG TPA: histidine kinase [Puia sp.]|nr:histidine kinase [Puia sp.]